MKTPAKRIAVIGAGVCGLCAIKSLKEEEIEPICFERTEHYGGTWRYHDDDVEGLASVTINTVANNSKEMSAISDFPPPKDIPNYMSHDTVYNLISEYCQTFDLLRHVRFRNEVTFVDKANDYEKTGRWLVTVKDLATGESRTDCYDGVMVCSGQFVYPNIPEFPNQEKFKGRIIHTKALKRFDSFTGENVVVVGLGCSGADAATEISNVCKKMYLSTRSGAWILPRMGPYGLPFDTCYLRRWSDFIFRKFPSSFSNWHFERILERQTFSHSLFGLKPSHHVWSQDPVVSDILSAKLVTGAVVVKGNIKTFTENGVIFEGENHVTEADTVIFATGYQWKFPALADGTITKDGECLNLWKCMYPAQLLHPTLCILGFILPLGPGFPLGEAQCRLAALVFSGKVKLPSSERMLADVKELFQKHSKRFKVTDRCTTKVDYVEYLDEIYSLMGAKPNMLKLLITDPKLFWALWSGPSVPYQYRLQGPHQWPGARKAILTTKERIAAPLRKTRGMKTKRLFQGFPVKLVLAILVFLFWVTVLSDTSS